MNRAAVFEGPRRLRVAARTVPEVGRGDALVEVHWAGRCGSDLDLWHGTRPEEIVRYPIVPGHEWSGVVEAIGDGVDPTWLYKRVVGENIRSRVSAKRVARARSRCAMALIWKPDSQLTARGPIEFSCLLLNRTYFQTTRISDRPPESNLQHAPRPLLMKPA